jgi:hypothetical protein
MAANQQINKMAPAPDPNNELWVAPAYLFVAGSCPPGATAGPGPGRRLLPRAWRVGGLAGGAKSIIFRCPAVFPLTWPSLPREREPSDYLLTHP